jgi:hypothetical protein
LNLCAQNPTQVTTDGFVNVTSPITLNFASGQSIVITFTVVALPGSGVNVFGITSCNAPGLPTSQVSPPFVNINETAPGSATATFGPAPDGTYKVNCNGIDGLFGGADNPVFAIKTTTVVVAPKTTVVPPTFFANPFTGAKTHPVSMDTGELFGFDVRRPRLERSAAAHSPPLLCVVPDCERDQECTRHELDAQFRYHAGNQRQ